MTTRWLAVVLCTAVALAVAPAFGQIRLQSRTIQPSANATAEFIKALKVAPGDSLHGIATFSRLPTHSERRRLERLGIIILSAFQGNSYRVRVGKGLDTSAFRRLGLTVHLTMLAAEDRVEPALWRGEFARYVVRPPGEKPSNYVLTLEGALQLSVRMHRGVTDTESRALLQKHALAYALRGNETWTAVVARDSLRALAASDAVQWIGPGPLPYLAENDLSREAIMADAVQSFNTSTGQVLGVGGKGVLVGIFDYGMDDNHGDIAGRVVRKDNTEVRPHATHIAGTVAGSGSLSSSLDTWGVNNGGAPFQWRGMAPLAQLIDAHYNNGADPATYREYIAALGMDVSNHSYPFGYDGDYLPDQARDQLIRGDSVAGGLPVPGRLQVTSAGNQSGYFSLTKQVKNALVVGNWDLTENAIDETSSLGPAHDGRIKPDVVAPGRTEKPLDDPLGGMKSGGFCSPQWPLPQCVNSSGIEERRNFYRLVRGTSMASAATTGVVALVLEQYAASFGVNIDLQPPLPSTLRGLMIHTARDALAPWPPESANGVVQPARPNFVTGWGMVDAQAAVKLTSERHLSEGKVTATCDVRTYTFSVPAGVVGAVRITLAWDDVAGDAAIPTTDPKLVNDLDLVLIDPAGTRHYPWQLDQKIVDNAGNAIPDAQQECGTQLHVQRQFLPSTGSSNPLPPGGIPAAARGRDHLNNVEVVDAPAMEGTWIAQVSGFRLPQGPQRFSLIGSTLTRLPIHATSLCELYPTLCRKLWLRPDICERFPKICATRFSIPRRGHIRIGFADLKQKIALPLDAICRYATACPCGNGALCANVDLQMKTTGIALHAAVYSSRGRLVKLDASGSHSKRLRFKTRPGEQYFIVLAPGKGARTDTDHDVSLRLE